MSKEIWLGPLLGSNRARLIQRCADLVVEKKSNRFLYLAASHPLLELVTAGILDGKQNPGLWNELPVYLFRGFVRRLLTTAFDEAGQKLNPRLPIDQEELPLKRSLVSQILLRLSATGQLKAIGPLARREGCVNTITNLIGEIQRAAKTPADIAEIISARVADLSPGENGPHEISRQIDFDQEVALIYATYSDLLQKHNLTEADADQLRALSVLQHENGFTVPWLDQVELLVLDGFFDFTPVQGEILRQLIPRVPEVLVNLNYDERNPEIFRPFKETIDHLLSIEPFDIKSSEAVTPSRGALAGLPQRLFNPSEPTTDDASESETQAAEIRYLECGDRETEIRAIAKEIRRLVLQEDYSLADIALVVRQRASYSQTIARVMREESLAFNLDNRVDVKDVPALRAALKLFAVLEELSPGEAVNPRVSELADLIKSEYFRLDEAELDRLTAEFQRRGLHLVTDDGDIGQANLKERLRTRYRIGVWDADALENTFAFVGSELHLSEWIRRAQRLVSTLPDAPATKELLNIETTEQARDPDEADQVENAETAKLEEQVERKRRPSRDVHPASILWASLVLEAFAARIRAVPLFEDPHELRRALVRLLDKFGFPDQIARPTRGHVADQELPQVMLNFNSLESLRRAFVAAIKAIEIAGTLGPPSQTKLALLIDEVRRALDSQSQLSRSADPRGLRILEATDVRGLRFRAVFIAGLIEGGFPLRAARDWIYPHEERERLKQYGLTLEDISPATLLKEEHYFYQAACRATERLYLSRPLVLQDDSETVASYYIDEVRRAIAPLTIAPDTIRRDYDGKRLLEISREPELSVALVRQQERLVLANTGSDLLPEPRIKRLLTLARNDGLVSDAALRRIEIERERAGLFFGPYDGRITDPDLLRLLKLRFGTDFVHSASSLGVYGNCSYRYFGQRVLKLEPRGEAALDLQAIDAGKLLHDILRRFFEKHRREPLYQSDRAQLQKELSDLADAVFDEHEAVVPPLNKQIWKIDREIRKILLEQVLNYECELQEKGAARGVVPAFFEVAFGLKRTAAKDPDSQDEPLTL
ncbi:MAG TPA: PD-(D/E)XK nuclease family protein, partial [Pyrinomonadaceae bacterium]|nr:PD-(D/E)XK nuclease family protein [Pyrinomonadaceae bacterium]